MADSVQARRWQFRPSHPQEARRQGEKGFQDWRKAQGWNQAHGDWADAGKHSWQDPSWSQDGPRGGGKGKSQGRGCGRRGKGSKARNRQEARHAQPRTEKQRHFKERRVGRAAERLTTAPQNINEHRVGSGSSDCSREAHDGASGPNPEPAELPPFARWFQ